MSQPYGPTGPYQQQPPQQTNYGQPPQGWQPYGAPQQQPPLGMQSSQPPMQPAKPPVVGWVAFGIALAGVVIGLYRLFPYDGDKSPAVLLGIAALILSIVGLVQATRRITTKGWVATLALFASFASIGAGWTATKTAEDVGKSERADCIASSTTFEELNACTD